jgi:site-specific recombinase XerD
MEWMKSQGQIDLATGAARYINAHRKMWAPKTTGRKVTTIRQFGRWKNEPLLEGYNSPTPARAVPHPLPEGIAGVISMIEVASNLQQEALVALCGLVGLRVSEARAVKPSHIDVRERSLHVQGKGDRGRIVPISNLAWTHLMVPYAEARTNGTTLVTYSDRAARRILTHLGERAGMGRPVSSHDLRATYATAVYDRTKDLRVVQELLGHSSSATTEIYTGVSMDKMRKAAELV